MKTKAFVALGGVLGLGMISGLWWWLDLPRPFLLRGSSEIAHGDSSGATLGAPSNGERTMRDPRSREAGGRVETGGKLGDQGSADSARRSAQASGGLGSSMPQRRTARQEGQSRPAASDAESVRQTIERDLALYFQVSNVDSTIREQLLQLSTAARLEGMEISQLGHEKGLSTSEIALLKREPTQKYIQDIYDLLGKEEGQYFLDSSYAAMFSPITDDFATRCAAAGTPVNPRVRNDIAINFSKNLRNPAVLANHPKLPDGSLLADRNAVQQASGILTAAQLTIFKQVLAERPYPKPGG